MNSTSIHTPSHLNDDLLNAWLDSNVTDAEADTIKGHLAGCERCRHELDALRAVKDSLAGLPDVQLPRSFALTPEQAFEDQDPEPASNVIRLLPVTRMLGIAAVIAFLVLGAATAFGPVQQSFESDAGSGETSPILSMSGTNQESGASEEPEAPVRAAAPGEVIDRGISATSSNSALDAMNRIAPAETDSDSDMSPLQVAWITSGAIAIVSLLSWAGLKQLTSRTRD